MSSEVTSTTRPSTPNQPYTILRIKRKRNEEPLDALVVETLRRKKSRGLGVFQYAETVEDGIWDNSEKKQGIQDKITRLAKETKKKSVVTTQSPLPSPSKDGKVRRYTVVDRDETVPSPLDARPPVLSSKDLNKQQKPAKDFRLYDAIPAPDFPSFRDTTWDEVDKFLPMLNDYLRLRDINTDNVVTPSANQDYVWDVFYHRPASLSEWNSIAANVGMLTGVPSDLEGYDSLSDTDEEYPDEADEDSNAEEYYKNDYPDEDDSSDGFYSDYDEFMDDHYSDDDF